MVGGSQRVKNEYKVCHGLLLLRFYSTWCISSVGIQRDYQELGRTLADEATAFGGGALPFAENMNMGNLQLVGFFKVSQPLGLLVIGS